LTPDRPGRYPARRVRGNELIRRIAAAFALLLALPTVAAAATSRNDVTFGAPSADGSAAVKLDGRVYLPGGPRPVGGWPAVIYLHGWGESKDTADTTGWATSLAARGYVVLTYSSRGWGRSTGLADLAGPNSLGDLRHAIDWLGTGSGLSATTPRPPVDAARIALMGTSYGGGQTLLAAARRMPVRAVAAVIPWSDLEAALNPGGWVKGGFLLGLYQSCLTDGACIQALPDALTALTAHANLDPVYALMHERSSLADAARIRVPTMLLQGRTDFLFPNEQTVRLFRALPHDLPRYLYFGQLGHALAPNPAGEVAHYESLVGDWFDRHVRGIPNGIDVRPRVEVMPDAPAAPAPTYSHDVPRTVSRLELPLTATTAVQARSDPSAPVVLHAGTASLAYSTAPLDHAVALRGRPQLTVSLSSAGPAFTHVNAELWAIDGTASRIIGLGSQWLGTSVGATPTPLPIAMSTISADLRAGTRVELRLVDVGVFPSAQSLWAYTGNAAGTSVTVTEGAASGSALALPVGASPSPATLAVGIALAGRALRVSLPRFGAADFGDGRRNVGRHIAHTYARPGTYRVTARVYDADGFGHLATRTIVVR
jgi:predicted acyl esterase